MTYVISQGRQNNRSDGNDEERQEDKDDPERGAATLKAVIDDWNLAIELLHELEAAGRVAGNEAGIATTAATGDLVHAVAPKAVNDAREDKTKPQEHFDGKAAWCGVVGITVGAAMRADVGPNGGALGGRLCGAGDGRLSLSCGLHRFRSVVTAILSVKDHTNCE